MLLKWNDSNEKVYLNISLGECDHLRQDIDNMQILHLVPGGGSFVEYVHAVGALLRLAVMNYIRNQIVHSVWIRLLRFWWQQLP